MSDFNSNLLLKSISEELRVMNQLTLIQFLSQEGYITKSTKKRLLEKSVRYLLNGVNVFEKEDISNV